MNDAVITLIKMVLNLGLALLLSPLFAGVIRKITALVQSRKGPPLLQPYMDLAKLLIKEDIESGHVPGMQRFSALLGLAAILSVTLFMPIGGSAPLHRYADAILMIYLLALAGISVLLAALSAGSTYSLIGMSREMMAMMTLEPLFAVAVVMAAFKSGSLRLDGVFNGAVYGNDGLLSGLALLGIMLFGFQAFVGRAPFDVTEAETEIMEGPLMEYSGPKLALFKYAQQIKLFVYSGLMTALFVPMPEEAPRWLLVLIFVGCQSLLVLMSTLLSATHARYRIDQVIRYYAILFAAALLALVAAVLGW